MSSENTEEKQATAKAMQLLLHRQRTEKELRCRLREKGFSPEAVDAAVSYVASFGYLDDVRYAEVYLHSMRGRKGRSLIRHELREKGVSDELIERAMADEPDDEEEAVRSLLRRKAGEPHRLEEKEKRRLAAYLTRKGFPLDAVLRQLRLYQEEGDI